MTIPTRKNKSSRNTTFQLKRVKIRAIDVSECEQWNDLMGEHHPLGAPLLAGAQLRYVVEHCGIAVALLSFSACSYHLGDRERVIGWDRPQMISRRNFVVQNSRFLVFPWVQHANLASKALGLAASSIEEDWLSTYGYAPMVLETFVDPESHTGVCYRAAGWQLIGHTKGYRRDKDNFYEKDSTPKTIWLKELRSDAFDLLSASKLPEEFRPFELDIPKKLAISNITTKSYTSLFTLMNSVPEFRKGQGKRYNLGFCLSIVACGIMAGCKTLREIEELAVTLSQPQLRALRCWKDPKKKKFIAPKHVTIWRVIAGIDANIFETKIQEWLNGDKALPAAIAIDGKALRATLHNSDGTAFATSAVSHEKTDFF